MPHSVPGPMAGRSQPQRDAVASHRRLSVFKHPLAGTLLATIRDGRSNSRAFGEAASRLAMFVLWEASRTLRTSVHAVPGFDGSEVEVEVIDPHLAGVSILRAGEVFAGPFRQLFPAAPLYHLGIRRNEDTLEHHVYTDSFGESITAQRAFILDPMLATGGSVHVAVERLRRNYDGPIDVLALVAAPLGVEVVLDLDPAVRIVTAALDDRLNEQGYIMPGLGDAGDRFFGTVQD